MLRGQPGDPRCSPSGHGSCGAFGAFCPDRSASSLRLPLTRCRDRRRWRRPAVGRRSRVRAALVEPERADTRTQPGAARTVGRGRRIARGGECPRDRRRRRHPPRREHVAPAPAGARRRRRDPRLLPRPLRSEPLPALPRLPLARPRRRRAGARVGLGGARRASRVDRRGRHRAGRRARELRAAARPVPRRGGVRGRGRPTSAAASARVSSSSSPSAPPATGSSASSRWCCPRTGGCSASSRRSGSS